MAKRIKVSFTKEEAEQLDLLVCANCGYRPNNHFSYRPYLCAFSPNKTSYKQKLRIGKEIK